jgi:hypothetical protein
VLAELVHPGPGSDIDEVLTITASWSADREPAEREPEVSRVMPAQHWISPSRRSRHSEMSGRASRSLQQQPWQWELANQGE